MKFSTVAQALSGALGVSAMAVPQELDTRATAALMQTVNKFETIKIEDAKKNGANDSDITRVAAVRPAAVGCSNPAVRVEWRNMTPANRLAFVNANLCLWNRPAQGITGGRAQNRWEELVWVHQQMAPSIHNAGMFLPWHRYYVHTWMRLLREECGYTAPLPWWDENRDAGNFAGSGLFTPEYFGTLPTSTNGQGVCVTDGKFAGKELHIGPGTQFTTHCLARGEVKSDTAQVNTNYYNTCLSKTAFADMRQCIEYGPHAYGHNGVGPTMADPISSPSDPIFFLHHTYIDHFWKVWQNRDQARWTTISGCAAPGNPCPALTMDTVLSSRGLRPDMKVSDFLDTENAYLCYKYDS